tara:strand:+ start:237 stop:443 length:207 start_codon:yes stop_codon:yes gene_type:complete
MLNEIVIYMKDEQIEINETNYKLELLNFIAEHTLNDLDNTKYIDEAVNLLKEENYKKGRSISRRQFSS